MNTSRKSIHRHHSDLDPGRDVAVAADTRRAIIAVAAEAEAEAEVEAARGPETAVEGPEVDRATVAIIAAAIAEGVAAAVGEDAGRQAGRGRGTRRMGRGTLV